jgi:predicted ATPase
MVVKKLDSGMELVYLWVDKYKNIEKQGFNFSPFKYTYDEKNNKLTVEDEEKKDKDYVSIFPDNINVTAIVGGNGSGKSTVLELVFDKNIMSPTLYIKVFKTKTKTIVFSNILWLEINPNYIYCLKDVPSMEQNNRENWEYIDDIYKTIFLYKYNLEYDGLISVGDSRRNNVYPNKSLSFKEIEFEDMKNIIYYISKTTKEEKIDKGYFQPDKILITTKKFYQREITKLREKQLIPDLTSKSDREAKDYLIYQIYLYMIYKINFIPNMNIVLNDNNNTLELDSIRNLINIYIERLNEIENSEDKLKKEIEDLLKYIKELNKIEDLHDSLEVLTIDTYPSYVIKVEFAENNFPFIKDLPACFDIDFEDTDKMMRYHNLSSGEKAILRCMFYIDNILHKNKSKKFIFLLDEPDNELHPDWQKKFLSDFIHFLEDKEQNIQLILTTHSPFFLSDLPKENVIFLQRDKKGNCNNVTKETGINPFGANIHTLLSHGFFMENGLMGEYAKSKINNAIKILNQKKLTEKDIEFCENIIKITGEPILKRQMQKMLDSKRLTKIDELEAEIELMKHRIEMIRKNQ